MEYKPKSRQQKLAEAIYPFFGDLASKANEDEYALRVCRHLQALKEDAIDSQHIASLINIWHSEYPEESSLTNDELLQSLGMLDDHISKQLRCFQQQYVRIRSPRAILKIINGGLSENPDRPYVKTEYMLGDY